MAPLSPWPSISSTRPSSTDRMLLKLCTTPPATLLMTSERAICRSTTGSSTIGLDIALARRALGCERKEHGEHRADARRAPEPDAPAVILDDLVGEGEAESSAFRLRGEEWIEHFLGLRGRDSATGVLDLDAHPPARPRASRGVERAPPVRRVSRPPGAIAARALLTRLRNAS